MNDFTFEELSPLRFERLVRDLLKKQFGSFENFSEGKDLGVDFRYSDCKENVLIVQCKRYKNYNTLKTKLKNEELDKVKKLSFKKYLLVVSTDLSITQKREIFSIFKSFLTNENQIITRSDLNVLLQESKTVIYEYPELWMKSVNIHQQIFNIGILQHSDFIKQRITNTLINFVPTNDYQNVINHFSKNNTLILSGNSGVGKSTIAYATLSYFIYHYEYRIIDLSYRNIQEAETFLMTEEPTFFLLDDFLGKVKLDKNDDFAHLLSFFIEKIEASQNKKLIITSRNHILQQGITSLSAVNQINNFIEKHLIELSSLTRSSRTEIRYNHIKNSNIESAFISNLLDNDYKTLIDHKNYNPRIVEHLTNQKNLYLAKIKANEYFTFFQKNLENPTEIWKQVYDHLPNELYKLVIVNKFLIKDKISYENLEKAINQFIKNDLKYIHYSYDEFEQVIRSLNGTVFIVEDEIDEVTEDEYNIIEFHNPSIIDFLENQVLKNKFWLKSVIENAIYFEQLFNWNLLDIVKNDNELIETFKHKTIRDFNNLENASFGYFEYDIPDGGCSNSLVMERRNYFLLEISSIFDLKKDSEVSNFIITELFRYTFEGGEDISEKIAFAQIAEELLEFGLVEDTKVIVHYINGFMDDIKEYVYLEYLLRHCSDVCHKLVLNNKELVKDVDNLFSWRIKQLKDYDYIDIMDFLDDFSQIKKIFPLRKATKLFKNSDVQSILDKSFKRLDNEIKIVSPKVETNYWDIDNFEVDNIIESLRD